MVGFMVQMIDVSLCLGDCGIHITTPQPVWQRWVRQWLVYGLENCWTSAPVRQSQVMHQLVYGLENCRTSGLPPGLSGRAESCIVWFMVQKIAGPLHHHLACQAESSHALVGLWLRKLQDVCITTWPVRQSQVMHQLVYGLENFLTSASPPGLSGRAESCIGWFMFRKCVGHSFLCLCRPFVIFERCLDSNQESCRSKQAGYIKEKITASKKFICQKTSDTVIQKKEIIYYFFTFLCPQGPKSLHHKF